MSRLLLVLLFAFGFTAISNADPIPKPNKVDSDKEAKKCAEAFIKATLNRKMDDAIKLCATPYLEPGGEVCKSLDDLKAKLSEPMPPAGFEMKFENPESIVLDKLNDWRKKVKKDQLEEKELKKYAEFIGKEGRVVVFDVTVNFLGKTSSDYCNLLVRVKNGEVKIVGVGRN